MLLLFKIENRNIYIINRILDVIYYVRNNDCIVLYVVKCVWTLQSVFMFSLMFSTKPKKTMDDLEFILKLFTHNKLTIIILSLIFLFQI